MHLQEACLRQSFPDLSRAFPEIASRLNQTDRQRQRERLQDRQRQPKHSQDRQSKQTDRQTDKAK